MFLGSAFQIASLPSKPYFFPKNLPCYLNKSTILPLFPPMDRNIVSALCIDRRVIGRRTRFEPRVFLFFFFPSGNRNLRIKWDNERRKRRKQERKSRCTHDGMFPARHPSSCQPVRHGLTWVARWGRFPFVQGFLLKTNSFLLSS